MDDIKTLLEILGEMPAVLYVELKRNSPHWTCIARVQENPPQFERSTNDDPLLAITEVLLTVAPLLNVNI